MNNDKMKNRPYSIEPYNPEWVTRFNSIKKILQDIFGSKALTIEHVGSTSIPGMDSKPIIDALIIVEKKEELTEEKSKMHELGYESRENYIAPDTVIFFKADAEGRKSENIHVCVKDSFKAIQFLTTRDYLRVHPERVKGYSELKRELIEKFPNDYLAYRAGKKDFLDETERLTKEWLK